MNKLNQVSLGIIGALCLVLSVLGATALAMVESDLNITVLPEQVMAEVAFIPPPQPAVPMVGQLLRPTHKDAPKDQPEALEIVENLELRSDARCLVPANWVVYRIQADENLDMIARRLGVNIDDLIRYNCLQVNSLVAGTILYVPPGASPQVAVQRTEQTAVKQSARKTALRKDGQCAPPRGWTLYQVHAGDTLFGLGLQVGASVGELQKANCMGSSTLLRVGQALYVPGLPVVYVDQVTGRSSARRTPQPTALPATPFATSAGNTPYPTVRPSSTPDPSASPAPTHTPGETIVPLPSETPITPVATEETPAPTDEPSPEPSSEPPPAPTDEPSPEPSSEPPPAPTDDPSPEPSSEPPPAPTDEPSPEPGSEPPPAPTDEPSPEPGSEPPVVPTDDPPSAPSEESPQSNRPFSSSLFVRMAPGMGQADASALNTATQRMVGNLPAQPAEAHLTILRNQWYYPILMMILILFYRI